MKKEDKETALDVFDFRWPIAAEYEVYKEKPKAKVKRGPKILERRGWYIRPKPGPVIYHRPLNNSPALFKQFAETPKTPEGVQEFASRYGMLDVGYKKDGAISLLIWYEQIDAMREAIAQIESGAWLPEGYEAVATKFVDLVLVNEVGRRRPTLKYRPKTLIAALRVQFALWVSLPEGVKLGQCVWDGEWFMRGPGFHRSDAAYCSPKCQKAHQYAKKKETMPRRKKKTRIRSDKEGK